MASADTYQRRDPLRACDICGVAWHKSDLTRIGPLRWACPDDKDGLTAEQISRHNASVRPLTIRPVKDPLPPSQTPIWQQAEAEIFNLVLKYGPSTIFGAESGDLGAAQSIDIVDLAQSAGWMAFYLGNLALENRRPRRWIGAATTKLAALADQIISSQLGLGDGIYGPSFAQTGSLEWGGVYISPPAKTYLTDTLTFDVVGNAACLLGLLRAYRVTGAVKYLISARAIATFLRRAQCVGLYSTAFSNFYATANSAGARLPPGPFPVNVQVDNSGLPAQPTNGQDLYIFRPSGLVCAWALSELKALDGDATYGGNADLVHVFALDPAATLTTSISQCLTWWQTAQLDAPHVETVAGFSSATPRATYSVRSSNNPGQQSWSSTDSTGIYSFYWALGVRALYELGSTYLPIYSFLREMTSNASSEIPTTWVGDRFRRSLRGTYKPALCLSEEFLNGSNVAGTTIWYGYDWRTVGVLAPIQSRLDAGSLRQAKTTMGARQKRIWQMALRTNFGLPATVTGGASPTLEGAFFRRVPDLVDDLRLSGRSGFSLQTSIGFNRPTWGGLTYGHYVDLLGAVFCADAYRYDTATPAVRG